MPCLGHVFHLPRFEKKSLRLATLPPCRERVCSTWCELGSGGVETSDLPVGPDVLDASDVVKEVVGDSLATGCRVRRVVWWFL